MKNFDFILLCIIFSFWSCGGPSEESLTKTVYVNSYEYIEVSSVDKEGFIISDSNEHSFKIAYNVNHPSYYYGFDENNNNYYFGLPTGTQSSLKLDIEYTFLVRSDSYDTTETENCGKHHDEETENCAFIDTTCSECDGSGISNTDTISCDKCYGSGFDYKEECFSCDGSGIKGEGELAGKCSRCKGSGYDNCSSCNGKGKTPSDCNACKGKGVVLIICPTCKGTKSVEVINTYYRHTYHNYDTLKISSSCESIKFSIKEDGYYQSSIKIPVKFDKCDKYFDYDKQTATATIFVHDSDESLNKITESDFYIGAKDERFTGGSSCKIVSLPKRQAGINVAVEQGLEYTNIVQNVNNILIQAGVELNFRDTNTKNSFSSYIKSVDTLAWFNNGYIDHFIGEKKDDTPAIERLAVDRFCEDFSSKTPTIFLTQKMGERYAWRIGANSEGKTLIEIKEGEIYRLYLSENSPNAWNALKENRTYILGDGHDGIGESKTRKNVEFTLIKKEFMPEPFGSDGFVEVKFEGQKGNDWKSPKVWYEKYEEIKDKVFFYEKNSRKGVARTEGEFSSIPHIIVYSINSDEIDEEYIRSSMFYHTIAHEILHLPSYGELNHINETSNVMYPSSFFTNTFQNPNEKTIAGDVLKYLCKFDEYNNNISQWKKINEAFK